MTRYRLFSPLLIFRPGRAGTVLAAAAAVVRARLPCPKISSLADDFLATGGLKTLPFPSSRRRRAATTVVLLVGPKPQVLAPKNTPVEIAGMQANPATVVVGEGAVVEFRNSDKVAHDFSVPGRPDIMPSERLSPGTVRKVRFGISGEYVARCTEYPHIADLGDRHQLAFLFRGG